MKTTMTRSERLLHEHGPSCLRLNWSIPLSSGLWRRQHKDITDRIIHRRPLQVSSNCLVSSSILWVQAQKSVCAARNELTRSLTWHLWNTYRAAAAAVSSVTQGFDLNEQVLFWRQLKLHGRPVGLEYAASSVPVLTIHNLRARKWVSEMQLVCAN